MGTSSSTSLEVTRTMRLMMLRRGLAILGATAVASAIAPGCAQPDSELFIRGVLKPAQSPDCTVRPEADSTQRLSGVIDVSFGATEYTASILVGNQLVPRGSSDLVRTETSRVTLLSADIKLEDTTGAEIKSFSVPISGFIDNAEGTTPGYGVASVTLMDAATAQGLSGTTHLPHRVVSKARVFGKTLGGADVQSQEFEFVIFTCYGCLVNFPADALDSNGRCIPIAGGQTSTATTVAPCQAGLDDPIDCRECGARNPACITPQ